MSRTSGTIIVLVVAAAVVGGCMMRNRTAVGGAAISTAATGKVYAPSPTTLPPEYAVSFGYKSQWLAVKTDDPAAVLKALGASNFRDAGWSEGVVAREGRVFATPPLEGWVLVVGDFSRTLHTGEEMAVALVSKLSAELGTEAQYFGTHRVVEYHAWVRAKNGEVSRAFAYLGERGETLLQIGKQSEEEESLELNFFDEKSPEANDDAYWERDDLSFPNEEDVMRVAGRWSIDPTGLEARGAVGKGLLADWHP